MRKPKILWISVPPHKKTGYSKVSEKITSYLSQYSELTGGALYYTGRPFRAKGVKWYPITNEEILFYVLERIKPDLVFSLFDPWAFPAFFEIQERGFKYIPYLTLDSEPLISFYMQQLYKTERIIVFSKFAQSLLKENGFDSVYIPHGVDFEKFSQVKRKGDNIGFVGLNRYGRKNIPLHLEVFKEVSKEIDKYFLLLTDPHPINGIAFDLIEIARNLKIDDKVVFPDRNTYCYPLSERELLEFYSQLKINLLLSCAEGFGIPIIEAEAIGIPTLVTNYSAMPELVPEFCRVSVKDFFYTLNTRFPVKWALADKKEAKEKILRLYKDGKLYQEVSKEAKEIAKNYDWNLILPKWKKIIYE